MKKERKIRFVFALDLSSALNRNKISYVRTYIRVTIYFEHHDLIGSNKLGENNPLFQDETYWKQFSNSFTSAQNTKTRNQIGSINRNFYHTKRNVLKKIIHFRQKIKLSYFLLHKYGLEQYIIYKYVRGKTLYLNGDQGIYIRWQKHTCTMKLVRETAKKFYLVGQPLRGEG